jgi:intracellular septation protein
LLIFARDNLPMKILFDFLPIVLFFGMFKYAEGNTEWAARTATEWLGFMVSGGVVGTSEAPVLLATVVVILATMAQIAWLVARGRKIDTMLWVSLGLVTLLGGATIYFHSESFIKWKPTVLYWIFAGIIFGAPIFGRNVIKSLMSGQMELPDPVWGRLNASWGGFFAFMGLANLLVAFNFSTDTWVNFKLFGSLGLMLVFVIGQSIMLTRHLDKATLDKEEKQ